MKHETPGLKTLQGMFWRPDKEKINGQVGWLSQSVKDQETYIGDITCPTEACFPVFEPIFRQRMLKWQEKEKTAWTPSNSIQEFLYKVFSTGSFKILQSYFMFSNRRKGYTIFLLEKGLYFCRKLPIFFLKICPRKKFYSNPGERGCSLPPRRSNVYGYFY